MNGEISIPPEQRQQSTLSPSTFSPPSPQRPSSRPIQQCRESHSTVTCQPPLLPPFQPTQENAGNVERRYRRTPLSSLPPPLAKTHVKKRLRQARSKKLAQVSRG